MVKHLSVRISMAVGAISLVGCLTPKVASTPEPVVVEPQVVDAGTPPAPVVVVTVTGSILDAAQKPVANAYVCDTFDADLMLGIDGVPRVIGFRTPKETPAGVTTVCAKSNAQGVFTLTAPSPEGFAVGKEFSVWAGSGLSRVPARTDRMALGIPSYGASFRLPTSTSETLDVGAVELKAVKPLAVSYRSAPKSLRSAKLSFAKGPSVGFLNLDFAQAEPSASKNGPLPVKAQGVVEVPLPVDVSYSVQLDAELMGQEAPKKLHQEAAHPRSEPVEFVVE